MAGEQCVSEVLVPGEMATGPAARFIAQKVLYPPMPLLRKPLWGIVRLITVGQLPADIREAYGLPWKMRQKAGFLLEHGPGHLFGLALPNVLGNSLIVNFAR